MAAVSKAITLATLSILPTTVLAGPALIPVPPDSFIIRHVDSVPHLTQQITLNPIVRRRLARHFHMSGPALVHYIQTNLVLKKTSVARRYQVYCVARNGREYAIQARLPAGTPVFAMRDTGQPILKLACGNPLVGSMPLIKRKSSLEGTPQVASLPIVRHIRRLHIAQSLAPNEPVKLVLDSTGEEILPPPAQRIAGSPLQALTRAHGDVSSLAYLAALPVLFGTSAAPEPSQTAALAFIGLGLTGVILRSRRKAQRK